MKKAIDFEKKLTNLVDECYDAIVEILKDKDYNIDKEDGILLNEPVYRHYTDEWDETSFERIVALRLNPEHENMFEYGFEDCETWEETIYDEFSSDIFNIYFQLTQTLNIQ